MNNTVISSFQKMIDVNTPIIYIHDYDFVRVDELIRQVVAEKKYLNGIQQRGQQTSPQDSRKDLAKNRHWKISFKKSTMRKKPKKNIWF